MLGRKCLMGALVGMSGGFILGLVGAFVLGPIWMIASEGNDPPPVNLLTVTLLLTIPTGLIIGIMVPIREASRRRQEAKNEEEEARSRRP